MTAETIRAAFKYLFREELEELQRLANLLPPNPIVVNIGAGAGTSGLGFLESRADMRLFTIDITNIDSPFGSLHSERNVVPKSGYPVHGQEWHQIHGNSSTVAWEYDAPDMVFVDGNHSYEGCMADLQVWSARLNVGGILSVHDYNKESVYAGLTPAKAADAPHHRAWPGVDKAVSEFFTNNDDWDVESIVYTLISFRKKK